MLTDAIPPIKILFIMTVASALALAFLLFGSSSEPDSIRAIGVFAASGWLVVSLLLIIAVRRLKPRAKTR
jgi:hypothetical protein